MRIQSNILITLAVLSLCMPNFSNGQQAVSNNNNELKDMKNGETFESDLNFLRARDPNLIELRSKNGTAAIIISPKYQGKVFTSTADGIRGRSFGWIHRKAFDTHIDAHMNAYGGEDRLWLGPEGGPFSLFFKAGDSMIYKNWHTPAPFDTESWAVKSSDRKKVTMQKDMSLVNYKGTDLKIKLTRTITLLSPNEIDEILKIKNSEGINMVGFATVNVIMNEGDFEWDKETGAPVMWNLDMFTPSPKSVIVIPYNTNVPGKVATTDYFGEIPKNRIKFDNGVLYFKADGKSRGKLGLSAIRSKKVTGSYASDTGVLTIVYYDIDPNAVYLNQEWRTDRNPFIGDAANAYNDGPLQDGSQMGPFYELESVSPAAFLKPKQTLTHRHYVFHFTGNKQVLNEISKSVLGVSLNDIENEFTVNKIK